MDIERIDAPQLHPPAGYSHVTVVEAGRLAMLAGQCPLDADGQLVGVGDVAAQTDRVVANCLAVLHAAGAAPDRVVRSTIYVVSTDPAELAGVWQRLTASALGPAFTTASTLVGVAALGYAGQLVEVELTAALGA